ncbi:glyoxalase/bleomycin resistance/dioxygenase family protein [uncultured Vibrio sp.]|uniref:glyoxalase/bleomycin resistance/dioxygenase family protein n=1 Tax=uncultured Vibrio sp. TaxID=114054 RepID=UPI0025F41B35|nr:glyoxalase/bleomycin resistance/dioxygenase family protein [uncultured Vibrio sp.]
MKPAAILVHVPNVTAGVEWYQKAFPTAVATTLTEFDFISLNIDGFLIEVVQEDEKVRSGKQGCVLYWGGENLEQALTHFTELGARLYRGPLDIEEGLSMCQVEDPFGNLIGLRGKFPTSSPT